MITLIIGQNAIGKSVYINNKAKEALKRNENIICNVWDTTYLDNRQYNTQRIEALMDLFDTEDIVQKKQFLELKTDEIEVGKSLSEILTIICKEGDELYLDEPEYGLSTAEINYLVSFIYKVSNTFDNIEIVTHSEIFFGILEAEKKTVELNSNNEYVLTDLRGSAYETID